MQSFVFAFFLCHSVFTQDVQKAHRTIDTLSSEYFWGRGYVQEGHVKAAQFVRDEFQKLKLEKLQNSYFQYFDFQVNIFSEARLRSKRRLKPGIDFLPAADCPTFKGVFKIRHYDSSTAYTKKDVVLLPKRLRDFGQSHIVLSGKKLTHTFAQQQSEQMGVVLLDTAQRKLGKRLKVNIKSDVRQVHSQNVAGYIPGSVSPDTFLIVCAHYDHLGGIGKQCYFPGANDNASGFAMLLQLAEYYSKVENRSKYSILFIAFGAEEVGLIGSKHYVEHPLVPLTSTKFVLNLDLMGSGLDGITVVNGAVYTKEFDQLSNINKEKAYVKLVKARGKAANSDHYYFSEHGVKSFFMYSLGEITAYHDVFDTADKVPLTKFGEMYQLITRFLNTL